MNTKMQQFDAMNPGFLAILDDHLAKRKRPSWIAGKLSARYLVAVTIQDIVDYIGEKWAPKLPQTAGPAIASRESEVRNRESGAGNREAGAGEETPRRASPVLAASHVEEGIGGFESGIGNREAGVGEETPPLASPVAVESRAEPASESREPGPVCPPPSTVSTSEIPILANLPAMKPKRARRTLVPRKRRAELLELQVAMAERCLEAGAGGIDLLAQ